MTKTTDDYAFLCYNESGLSDVIANHLHNPHTLFVVEIAENFWVSNKQLKYAFSDRIIVTPTSNLKHGIMDNSAIQFLRFQDLATISYGIQQSVLRSLRRYSQKW